MAIKTPRMPIVLASAFYTFLPGIKDQPFASGQTLPSTSLTAQSEYRLSFNKGCRFPSYMRVVELGKLKERPLSKTGHM